MITHYERQSNDLSKSSRWRGTAQASAAEWRHKLEQLEAEVVEVKPEAYKHTPMIFNCTPNYQDLFDCAVEHLARQKKQAAVWDDRFKDSKVIACRYRTEDGCACVVGHVLPDDVYDPAMEGQIVYRIVEDYPGLPEWFREKNLLGFLDQLQDLHDTAKSMTDLKDGLENIAADYRLDRGAIDGIKKFDVLKPA
jgi:hypothetical protein